MNVTGVTDRRTDRQTDHATIIFVAIAASLKADNALFNYVTDKHRVNVYERLVCTTTKNYKNKMTLSKRFKIYAVLLLNNSKL